MRAQIWSSGGGVQSTAIAALICSGELPKPDLCVIADTGREASSTWEYLDEVVDPALKKIGVELHRVPHDFKGKGYNHVDLYGGKNKDKVLMPLYTSQAGTEREGRLPQYCSSEWKVYPIRRFCREQGFKKADVWIGFTVDEVHRCRFEPKKPWRHSYPLIDLGMRRSDCMALLQRMGWPEPPRSSCWMCPHRTNQEWNALSPLDMSKAQALERKLRERDEHIYLHRNVVPLAEALAAAEGQQTLFEGGCESGYCFV